MRQPDGPVSTGDALAFAEWRKLSHEALHALFALDPALRASAVRSFQIPAGACKISDLFLKFVRMLVRTKNKRTGDQTGRAAKRRRDSPGVPKCDSNLLKCPRCHGFAARLVETPEKDIEKDGLSRLPQKRCHSCKQATRVNMFHCVACKYY